MFDTLRAMSTLLDPPRADPPRADPPAPAPPDPPAPGPLTLVELRRIQARVTAEARSGGDPDLSERELVDEIAALEALGHSIAALQAERIGTFARSRVAARTAGAAAAEALDPQQLERSVAGQVGLACRVSPTVGRVRLRVARDLRAGLDHVRGLFVAGALSRDKAVAVVTGTADLDPDERAQVDARLAGHDLRCLGIGRLRDLVRKLVAEVAPETFRARVATARRGRRVTLRPGEDGMCWLTAHLPIEQGAAVMAALHAAVRTSWADAAAAITRSRSETMADTLVERATGQATAEKVDVEIQALVPVEALVDPDNPLPAIIPGHGPVPVDRLLGSRAGRAALRRLVTRDGIVIGGDSRQRSFTGVLADLVGARDGHRCRESYCDAPIRHIDHIRRVADHGRTCLDNGRGVCEFHNYLREQPGWTVLTSPDGIVTTTPTGHRYLSPTPRAA